MSGPGTKAATDVEKNEGREKSVRSREDRLVAETMEQIRRASLKEPIATVTAQSGKNKWSVTITKRAGEYFEICGRGTRMDVYIHEANAGYLVSVPNFQRCGHVPEGCSTNDIINYVGIENQVDAATLAAAVRCLIDGGYV